MSTQAGNVPTEAEVLEYFQSLSNWGRWGEDDELGTLNLISPQKRLQALALASKGMAVSCARPIVKGLAADVANPALHLMYRSGERWAYEAGEGEVQSASDFLGISPHGFTVTHIDTPSHMFWQGRMYNGRPASAVTTQAGAKWGAVTAIKDGIVTRGTLLDIAAVRGKEWLEASEPVFTEDLEMAERAQGVRVEEGDALLLRLGWYKRRIEVGPTSGPNRPGLHVAALPWLRERGVALLTSDVSHDVFPSGYEGLPMPVHQVGIVAMGLWLLDAANFEEAARECRKLGRWQFTFVVSSLRFTGATASPVNPLAIF